MKKRITKNLYVCISLLLMMMFVTLLPTKAVDYSKSQTKYGKYLETLGVRAVALFDMDTGKFSAHGLETKYGETWSIFLVQKVNNISKSNTTYSASSEYQLYEYHSIPQTTYIEYLDFLINTSGSW